MTKTTIEALRALAAKWRREGSWDADACADELEAALGRTEGEAKPHVRVGMIGHVGRGKTTLAAALTKIGTTPQPEVQAVACWVDPHELLLLVSHGGMIVASGHCQPESSRTMPLFARPTHDGGEVEKALSDIRFIASRANIKTVNGVQCLLIPSEIFHAALAQPAAKGKERG